MRRATVFIHLALCLAGCGRGQTNASLQTLGDHTPAVVNSATLTGTVNQEAQLELRIALPLRDENALDTWLETIYDPQSSAYGAYLTPSEFTARYAPDTNAVANVRESLLAGGFEVDDDTHGTLLGARGNVATAEAFFHTQLNTYQDANGSEFFAPATAPAVDEGLNIAGVYGLHTAFVYKSNFRMDIAWQNKASPGQLRATDIRKAYNVPASATGAGQVVALYELDGYKASDIATYASLNGIAEPTLTNVLVDGVSGQPQSTNGQGEVTLDIELVNALVPAAQGIRVYEAPNSGTGGLDEWNEIANPTLGDKLLVSLVSSSWGLAENESGSTEMRNEGVIFKQMAAQGQTVAVASGDEGAKADGSTVVVSDPASQPWALGVGGTTLSTNNGVYAGESAWSGSGGGISSYAAIPSWQKNAIKTANQASTTFRNVPDVALDANPSSGYAITLNGSTASGYGGTSCAAPLWAAFFAQVNQARAANGLAPLGFAAPALYLLAASTTDYASDFHDVTSGNNGTYSAATGYDNVTGLGSFNANNLIQSFTSSYGRSTFNAPSGLTPTNP